MADRTQQMAYIDHNILRLMHFDNLKVAHDTNQCYDI